MIISVDRASLAIWWKRSIDSWSKIPVKLRYPISAAGADAGSPRFPTNEDISRNCGSCFTKLRIVMSGIRATWSSWDKAVATSFAIASASRRNVVAAVLVKSKIQTEQHISTASTPSPASQMSGCRATINTFLRSCFVNTLPLFENAVSSAAALASCDLVRWKTWPQMPLPLLADSAEDSRRVIELVGVSFRKLCGTASTLPATTSCCIAPQ
mmetsp:Transcript_41064/g.93615  ORF Transcript_41064/g.93615 Transcript_41064/m.93615 type:complete len:212 (+) Transcript_41064:120-755(+)